MPGPNKHRQRGISTTEVLVSAVLIGIALMCISPMLSQSFRSTRLSKERAAATQAAQRVIEQIQAAGFSGAASIVNALPASRHAVQTDDLQGTKLYIRDGDGAIATEAKPGYKLMSVTRDYHYDPRDNTTLADDLIQVTVKITWPGSQGQSITMGITLARNGLN
jgi:type II secretory pathway pseudopilin PulG